jgi:hypothetical protein
MSQSFGVVEDKVRETEFFLEKLRVSVPMSSESQYYFSAFVSAARSVTFALQATMDGIPGFEDWYGKAQVSLRADPLVPLFKEIRNDCTHKGINHLNRVTLEHLTEYLRGQMREENDSHVIVLADVHCDEKTILADAVKASTSYFISLLQVVFECYLKFKCVVDPRWHFTRDNFRAMGKGLADALGEIGLPPIWASCAPSEDVGWRALRSQQPPCLINDLFRRYLRGEIPDPDCVP